MAKTIELVMKSGNVVPYPANLYRKNKKSLNQAGHYKIDDVPSVEDVHVVYIQKSGGTVVPFPKHLFDASKERLSSLGYKEVDPREIEGMERVEDVEEVEEVVEQGTEESKDKE